MRSADRDARAGTVTFSGTSAGAAGAGQSNGVAYTVTNPSAGIFVYNFDPRIRAVSVVGLPNPGSGGATMYINPGGAPAPGTFTLVTVNGSFGGVNMPHSFVCTALDKRT